MAIIPDTILVCDGAGCDNVILPGDRIGLITTGVFEGIRVGVNDDTVNILNTPGRDPRGTVTCGDCTDKAARDLTVAIEFTEAVVNLSLAAVEVTK